MPQYTNFYENLTEAQLRLKGTIVMYDKEPYYVLAITDHRGDGVFRVYLEPIGWTPDRPRVYPNFIDGYPSQHNTLGTMIDEWMGSNPDKILRKKMNSPLFNKFRPFPLGMVNQETQTYYVERQPARKSEQGLTRNMLLETPLTTGWAKAPKTVGYTVEIYSPSFKACLTNNYPSAEECLQNLCDPTIENESAAFHRQFAFIRGPVDMIFLAYKGDVIGVLPKANFDYVKLGRTFSHCREVVQDLGIFNNVM